MVYDIEMLTQIKPPEKNEMKAPNTITLTLTDKIKN